MSSGNRTPRHSSRPPSSGSPRYEPRDHSPSTARFVPNSHWANEALSIVIGDQNPRSARHQATGIAVHDPKRKLHLWDEIEGSSTGSTSLEIDSGHQFYEHVNASISFALHLMSFTSSQNCLAEMGSVALRKRNKKQRDMLKSVHDFLTPLDHNFLSILLSNRHITNGSYLPPHSNESEKIKKTGWQPHLGGTIMLNRHVCTSLSGLKDAC